MFFAFAFHNIIRRLLAVAACSFLILGTTPDTQAQQIRVQEKVRGAFPALKLKLAKKQAGGQEAINQLGKNLAAVAGWYGKSESHLRADLLTDRRLRIDQTGRLLVVDELETPLSNSGAATAMQSVQDGQLAPLEQTFRLHSKPGSQKTLYLDFDGATLSGTGWNTNGNTIAAAAFDIDGRSGFSSTELQRIQYIWQRVAEDFAPFDINVTTEAPPPERIRRSSMADQEFGTIVLITRRTGVYSCSCGGVAYVGVFGMTTDFYKPALVFYDVLGSGNEKFVAEAVSHEAGHNLGLTHDGGTGTGYYAGHGNDPATSWAPIMGIGYYKTLVQFSRGEYAGANNKQDDFAVVQSYGLPLRADDHGNAGPTATTFQAYVAGGSASGSMDGVLETASDRDMFAIAAGKGQLSASAATSARSPNADLQLSLYDAAGNLLVSSNPAGALGAKLTFQLPAAGTYYLDVRPTGRGNPATDGYSSYGSVGYYRLSASFGTAGSTPPNAVLTASAGAGMAPLSVTLDGSGSSDSDGIRFYYWDFGDGTADRTGTLRTAQKTYYAPGQYTVRLSVVDATGLISTATQTISVGSLSAQRLANAQSIRISMRASRTTARATAIVKVVDQAGQALRNATVKVVWSGNASGTAVARTNRRGEVTLRSRPGNRTGCMGLSVISVEARGYSFDASNPPSAEACG
jgi:PKD repeat protein